MCGGARARWIEDVYMLFFFKTRTPFFFLTPPVGGAVRGSPTLSMMPISWRHLMTLLEVQSQSMWYGDENWNRRFICVCEGGREREGGGMGLTEAEGQITMKKRSFECQNKGKDTGKQSRRQTARGAKRGALGIRVWESL